MTDAELWQALTRLADELDGDTPSDDVDAELRAMGIDPDTLGSEAAAFVDGLKQETDR